MLPCRVLIAALALLLVLAAPASGDGFDDWEAGWFATGTDLRSSYRYDRPVGSLQYDAVPIFRSPAAVPVSRHHSQHSDLGCPIPSTSAPPLQVMSSKGDG